MPYTPMWPNPYLPAYNQGMPVQPQYQACQPQTNGVIKVNGPESALQYSLGPNSMSPALFDMGGGIFYIVSTDGTGAKTLESFDYSPHVEETPPAPSVQEAVSREEFDRLVAKVDSMEARNGVHGPVQTEDGAASL